MIRFKALKPQVLIDRLINRHHHLLCLRVCNFLNFPANRVLVHWACAKIKRSTDSDSELSSKLVAKLSTVSGVSYAEIATSAYHFGRSSLAIKLLDFESRAIDQVPLLISMKQEDLALKKAVDSGDTDLGTVDDISIHPSIRH